MPNVFTLFRSLLPHNPLQVGDVVDYADGVATIQLPDGGTLVARGSASIGQRVFFQGGVIQGEAPSLTYVEVDV